MIANYISRSQDCDSNCIEYTCTCNERVRHYIWTDEKIHQFLLNVKNVN